MTPAVLIPRPETELVVERTLAQLRPDATEVPDLGTGSGAVALAIARERPALRDCHGHVRRGFGDAWRNAARLQIRNVSFGAALVRAAGGPSFRPDRLESSLRCARRRRPDRRSRAASSPKWR